MDKVYLGDCIEIMKQMPERLLERIIKTSSNEGDLVLDPFGGTGTTAFVAKQLKRHYITIEISQTYFEVINNRLNDLFTYKEE